MQGRSAVRQHGKGDRCRSEPDRCHLARVFRHQHRARERGRVLVDPRPRRCPAVGGRKTSWQHRKPWFPSITPEPSLSRSSMTNPQRSLCRTGADVRAQGADRSRHDRQRRTLTEAPSLIFFRYLLTASFDAGRLSSDGGVIVLREIASRLGLAQAIAGRLRDDRDPTRVQHSYAEMVTARMAHHRGRLRGLRRRRHVAHRSGIEDRRRQMPCDAAPTS